MHNRDLVILSEVRSGGRTHSVAPIPIILAEPQLLFPLDDLPARPDLQKITPRNGRIEVSHGSFSEASRCPHALRRTVGLAVQNVQYSPDLYPEKGHPHPTPM